MKEKELFLNIIKDSDVLAIFELVGEKSKSKNPAYRKQRLKQMLNSTSGGIGPNKQPIWDWLSEEFAMPEYEGLTINQMLKQFIVNEPYVPLSIRFFTLKRYQPEFFEEHFSDMVENVKNEEYFLTDLIRFETDEELEEFWNQYLPFISETGGLRFLIDSMYGWVETRLPEEVKEWNEKVKDLTLREVEAILPKEDNLGFSSFVALLTFLKHGEVDNKLKAKIFFALQYDFFQIIRTYSDKLLEDAEETLQSERQVFQQKQKEMKKELRLIEQQTKQKEAEMKKTESKSSKEIEKIAEELRTTKVKYEKENHILSTEVERLNRVVLERQQLTEFFKRGVTQKYNDLKWVICHNIPLMFAPDIFPEFEFVNLQEVEKVILKDSTCLWIQQSGLSYTEKRQLTLLAQKYQIPVQEFHAKEERELIMELSVALKKSER